MAQHRPVPAHRVTEPAEASKDRQRLFTVRIWNEVGADGIEHRGQVRDVTSGAFRSFRTWPELTSFLADRLGAIPSDLPPQRVPRRSAHRRPQGGTMNCDYDAVVIGARCAGAPTAMLLAQNGHRVLLVDRAHFPSDTLSTLVIHAPGVAALDRWGLLDEVTATGCPPIETYSYDFGPFVISGRPHPAEGGSSTAYAPRRTVLDTILVDAAARAGVEVRAGLPRRGDPGGGRRRRRHPRPRRWPSRRRSSEHASSSAPTAGTRWSHGASAPSSTTPSRCSRTRSTRTGAGCARRRVHDRSAG